MNKHIPNLIKILSKISPQLAAAVTFRIFATPTRIPRPASEMAMFESAKKFRLSNGIAAFEWGDPNGPLVMLIHGWNGRGTQISPIAKNLAEKNFRIVALDGPGHGDSPPGPNGMTNPAHFADFIIHAQRELDPRGAHSVIAHSFGGGCSVLAAKRGLKTKSLVLVASPAFYERVVDFFATSVHLSDQARKIFIDRVVKISGIHPRELNVGAIGAELNLPLLIVHDKNDNAVNFMAAEAIMTSWPGAKLIATEGLGHRRILKDAKVLEAETEFIVNIP